MGIEICFKKNHLMIYFNVFKIIFLGNINNKLKLERTQRVGQGLTHE